VLIRDCKGTLSIVKEYIYTWQLLQWHSMEEWKWFCRRMSAITTVCSRSIRYTCEYTWFYDWGT